MDQVQIPLPVNTRESYILSIEDTSGDPEMDRLRPMAYDEVAVVFLCFSIDSRASFFEVKDRVNDSFISNCHHLSQKNLKG